MDTVLTRAEPEINLTRTILNQPGVLAAFILLCALFGLGTWLVARRLGWHRLFATLAAIGLSLAIAVTLVRPGGHLPNPDASPVAMCLHDQFSLHGGLQVLKPADAHTVRVLRHAGHAPPDLTGGGVGPVVCRHRTDAGMDRSGRMPETGLPEQHLRRDHRGRGGVATAGGPRPQSNSQGPPADQTVERV